jgi:hypothetical protein
MSRIANTWPAASVMTADEVGARLLGQTSFTFGRTSAMSAWRESRLDSLAVMEMTLVPFAAQKSSTGKSSFVMPEFEIASTTSWLVTMPRSPCEASAACRKNEGVPVEANVAASLAPMCPDLPTPVTTRRPVHA